MVEGLRQLIDLQKLDDELVAAEEEKARLPGRRAELAGTREAAEQRVAVADQALQEAEAAQRKAEQDVQDQEALYQKLEGQQFQVKSNDAYTALLREMEQAREAVSQGETRILEAMEGIETSSRERESARTEADGILARVGKEEAALDAREAELDRRIGELREARGTFCERMAGELIEQYEKIAARRRPALARVENEICLGCRVNIPPQLHIELIRGEQLITCMSCHRILVHETALAQTK